MRRLDAARGRPDQQRSRYVPTAACGDGELREVPRRRDLGARAGGSASWPSPTRSRATAACSTSRRPTRACSRSSPTRRRPRSRPRASTRTRSRRSASSASSSSPRRSSARSCRAICRGVAGVEIAARNRADAPGRRRLLRLLPALRRAASRFSWRTFPARAFRRRCSCRRSTRRCTSRSTTRRRSPTSSARIDRHLQRYAATRKFLTVFFGLLEPDIGHAALRLRRATIRPCCGGPSGAIEQLKSTGVPLGMFPNAVLEGGDASSMEQGDLLCVYTRRRHRGPRRGRRGVRPRPAARALSPSGTGPASLRARSSTPSRRSPADVPQYDDQTLLIVRRT